MSEDIKIAIGSATPLENELSLAVKGRDTISGLPRTIMISSEGVREALSEALNGIVEVVRQALDQCPPQLAADLVDRGIVLAGGGALVRHLDRKIGSETHLPVIVAEDPLRAVANGTGAVLQNLSFWLNEEY
jgi:rod shape-determining protein MreB